MTVLLLHLLQERVRAGLHDASNAAAADLLQRWCRELGVPPDQITAALRQGCAACVP